MADKFTPYKPLSIFYCRLGETVHSNSAHDLNFGGFVRGYHIYEHDAANCTGADDNDRRVFSVFPDGQIKPKSKQFLRSYWLFSKKVSFSFF